MEHAHDAARRTRAMPGVTRGRHTPQIQTLPDALVVPVRSPQREAHELRVLMKPHEWTRAVVRERVASDAGDPLVEQPWDASLAHLLIEAAGRAGRRVGCTVATSDAGNGERWRLAYVDAPEDPRRAVALVCSAAAPGVWFTFGRLAVRGGLFWRRERGRLLNWRVAADVGLTRETRALVRDLLRKEPRTK